MRVTLVIGSLGAGGAERVISIMANWWATHGHHVTLVTLDAPGQEFFRLDARIARVGLGLMKDSGGTWEALQNNAARIRALGAVIAASQSDAVISFTDTVNVLTLLATARLGVPVIVSERVDPRRHGIGTAWSKLRQWTYARASAVVVQSEGVADWMRRTMRLDRCEVIPNPVPPLDEQCDSVVGPPSGLARTEHDGRVAMAMGRLVEQKGFDLLLQAFSRVAAGNPAWRLVIVGDGPARSPLCALAAELGVSDRVSFSGRVHNPQAWLHIADLFVLSSRYEGFPNALLEAMACGVACVSFDCQSGPADIIRPEINGLLVPPEDISALANALDRLMKSDAERSRLASRAQDVLERFGVDRVMGAWDELIATSARRAGAGRPVALT